MHAGFVGEVPDQLTAGDEYAQRAKLMGMTMTVHWEITRIEPDRLIEMRGSAPGGMTITTRYELDPAETGTSVTMRSQFTGGPADTLMASAIGKVGQKAADQTVARLSELLG